MKQFTLALFLSSWSSLLTGQGFRPLIVDPTREYEIVHEDSTISLKGETFKVSSDLVEANNDLHQEVHEMKFAKAQSRGDTLTVLIFESHPTLRHEYRIRIVGKTYMIDYHAVTSGDVKRKIKTEGYGLILSSETIAKGKELRGYTEYRGNCVKGCTRDKLISISGNFKVMVE